MIFDHPEFDGHERVHYVWDDSVGLRAIVALHHSRNGMPACGGVRFRTYVDDGEALTDVLRLSRGMTYKNVLADLPLGGGKSVIIGDPATDKTPELLRSFGRFVESLRGAYLCGPDVGTNAHDMDVVAEVTRHVGATNRQMGSSALPTAEGTFHAIRATAQHLSGAPDVSGLRFAVQGAGAVGRALVRHLVDAGASVVVADIDADAVGRVAAETGAQVVDPDLILSAQADVLAPCALGGILSEETIPHLRVKAVCGAANNQLATAEDGARLRARGIHLVPDFVASGGGVIAGSAAAGVYPASEVAAKLGGIFDRSLEILRRAEAEHLTPHEVAERMARELLAKDRES
jgi:leucine dehydrogenase